MQHCLFYEMSCCNICDSHLYNPYQPWQKQSWREVRGNIICDMHKPVLIGLLSYTIRCHLLSLLCFIKTIFLIQNFTVIYNEIHENATWSASIFDRLAGDFAKQLTTCRYVSCLLILVVRKLLLLCWSFTLFSSSLITSSLCVNIGPILLLLSHVSLSVFSLSRYVST